jgi:predicted transport protein
MSGNPNKKANRNPSMAKSPEEMAAAMIANLKEKTGKTLKQWLPIMKAAKLEKHGQIVKFLKTEHGLTHGFANMIVHEFLKQGKPVETAGDLVETQYAGAKSELRPIYDALLKAIQKFGTDVDVAPKKAYVSFRRSKQFAIVQPSTKTRVDVGINLKGQPADGRLENSGSFNAMVSHRVRIESAKEVDKTLVGWLKQAYESA